MSLQSFALTTVAAVNAAASTGASDARIEQLIHAVSQRLAGYVGVEGFGYIQFTTDAPDEYQGDGRHHLLLRVFPVLSVQEVKIGGSAVTDYTLPTHLKRLGILYRQATWPISAPVRGALLDDPDLTPGSLGYNVTVAFKGGYILPQFDAVTNATHNPDGAARTLPYDLEEACINEVIRRILRPFPELTMERTPGGHSMTWSPGEAGKGLSTDTRATLDGYKRVWCA